MDMEHEQTPNVIGQPFLETLALAGRLMPQLSKKTRTLMISLLYYRLMSAQPREYTPEND
jgi:hypothetical protein